MSSSLQPVPLQSQRLIGRMQWLKRQICFIHIALRATRLMEDEMNTTLEKEIVTPNWKDNTSAKS